MAEEIPSLENFAVTLEKLKLPKTASIFREELEKKNSQQKIEKTLSLNPLVSLLMKKLETPKPNKKSSKKEESKEISLLSLNLSSNNKNNSLLETKIFKKLYENFDTQKMSNKAEETKSNLVENKDKKENKTNKINTSEILSNSELNNLENKSLNATNNNEEDSIFTNANASNMDDSNATQFNPPPQKLNPRRKNQDK